MTDYKKLCAELVEKIEYTWGSGIPTNVRELLKRARVALAEPEPEEPTDEELRDLWSWAAGQDQGPWPTQQHCFARTVLARWGRPVPQPVPVSERLPGDQLCWWYEPDEDDDGTGYGGNWTLLRIRGCVSYYTHWLPAHVLPLPTAND
jgi:hypothetical protein